MKSEFWAQWRYNNYMKNDWEGVICPICETDRNLATYYDKVTTWEYPGNFSYLKCGKCGIVLQSPRIRLGKIGRYYKTYTYWGFDLKGPPTLVLPRARKERFDNYGPLYKRIFSLKSRGKILDVGCGLGLFLSEFKERGWETVGTETSKDVAKFARDTFGLDVRVGDLLTLNLPKDHFDAVVFSGVFEHVYKPAETLKKVRSLLKKDGIMVIVTPNLESLGHLIFRKRWVSIEGGRHVFLYTPKTIKRILRKSGLKTVDIFHNYWRHNIYGLFTSFRYTFSPRFKNREAGNSYGPSKNDKVSFLKEIGKLVGITFSYIAATLEVILERAESVIIYAKKN